MNRRDFLFKALLTLPVTSSLPLLLNLTGCQKKEQLNYFNPELKDDIYIQLNLYGAPSRWSFDDLLTPYKKADFISGPRVGNIFADDTGALKYQTFEHRSLNLPPLWKEVFTINGNKRRLTDYLDNFIFIRGIHSHNAGHPAGGVNTVRPSLDSDSILENLSGRIDSLLPPIMIGDNPVTRSFNSAAFNGLQVNTRNGEVFKEVFNPFHISSQSKSLFNKDDSLKFYNDTLSLFKNKKQENYYANLEKTKQLFFDDYDSLQLEYLEILEKYLLNMHTALNDIKIPGVDNIQIKTPEPSEYQNLSGDEAKKKYGRFAINIGHYLTNSPNVDFKSGGMDLWAEQFALSEFLLKKGLTNVIQLSTPLEMGHTLSGIKTQGFHTQGSINKGKKTVDVSMDAHHVGSVINNYATSRFFTGLSACLMTFIDELKSIKLKSHQSLFDKTLIHITSEFNRITRDDLSGSDHLGASCTSTFISGKNHTPLSIGNIKISDTRNSETNGESAIQKEFSRELTQKDVLHTVYELLEIPSPLKRAEKLLELKNGSINPLIKKAQNI